VANIFPKIDTVILRVKDLEKARRWYEEKLGFEAGYVGSKEKIVVFNLGTTPTSLTIYELKPGEKSSLKNGVQRTYPIFYSENINNSYETLRNRDVRVGKIEGDSESQWFSFYDVDDNQLEACHY
jgi:catechol 2,3-dioxygenase-like lactoylglutathione lyase family enzyme